MRHGPRSLPAAACRSAALCLTVFCACLLCPSLPLCGQTQTLLGIEARVHAINHSGGFTLVEGPCSGIIFKDGGGFGQSLGLHVQYRDRGWSISGILSWNRLPSTFRRRFSDYQSQDLTLEWADGTPDSVPYTGDPVYDLRTRFGYSTLSLELMMGWRQRVGRSVWSLGLAAGPTMSFVLGESLDQKVSTVSPKNTRMANPNGWQTEDNGRTLVYYTGDVDSWDSPRLGLRTGIFAEHDGREITIIPGIFYDLVFPTVGKDWKIHMLTGQVSVMIKL